ncbi:MAG: proline dehydrogenase family protein [Acidobacteriota bacterium]
MNGLFRRLSESEALARLLTRLSRRYKLAQRFVAGESTDQAIQAVRELNSHGILCSLDLLGEGVSDAGQARRAAAEYSQLLASINTSDIQSNISIKLTQLGLDIDQSLCRTNLISILEKARDLQNFVRIDMEGSDYTQATIDLFREQLVLFGHHVGIVIQSYLYRSERDIAELSRLACNIRLCKGAYNEPPRIAFPKKSDVDRNFVKLLETLLRSRCYTAIATHDDKMIRHARKFIAAQNIDCSKYEFQMLYGIRREYQLRLRREGYQMRVYVPFGTQWAPYLLRRVAERPANLLFVLKNLYKG